MHNTCFFFCFVSYWYYLSQLTSYILLTMNIKTDLEFQLRRYCYNICTMNILFETQLVVVPGSNKNKQNCSDLECWVSPAPMLWSGHCCQYCHCLTVSGSGRCRVKTALRSRVLILPDPEQSGTYTHSAWSPALTTLSCLPPAIIICCKFCAKHLQTCWECGNCDWHSAMKMTC